MRIWSLHPKYLDKKELIDSWNDGLRTIGILTRNHQGSIFRPELSRFRSQSEPIIAVEKYLLSIANEAKRRGYMVDIRKLPSIPVVVSHKIPVSSGQIEYEWRQLMHVLAGRSPGFLRRIEYSPSHDINPIFYKRPGHDIETWEKLD